VPLPALLGALSFFLLGGVASASAKTPTPAPSKDPIVQVLDRDAILAIRNPEFVPAGEAELAGGEKVLGVVIGGEARAYPLIDLDAHEIVDDVVAGKPIAATW
jgi:Protein of unknown function (DUF3179)